MKRTFLVDGVDLCDSAQRWDLLFSSGTTAPAQRRIASLDVFARSGPITRRGGFGVRQLTFGFVVRATGTTPVESNADILGGLLARAETVTRVVDLRVMSAQVVEVQVSEPERFSEDLWHLQATLTLQPFWREATTLTSPVMSPGNVVFDQWAGSTGDVQDGILRVKGPLTRCAITGRGGVSFDRSLTAAQYVYIDVASFRAWYSTSASAWAPTSTAVLLDYPAAGPLVLEPSAAGVAVSFTGDGFVTSGTEAQKTGITLRGGRYWL